MSLSPNFGPRRDGLRPELVVLHYTAMADADAAERVLCTPEREVSAHYLIRRKGQIIQLVAEEMRAWHAGVGQWGGQADVNSRSIGIELDNTGTVPFAAPMMDALEALLPGILTRWQIPARGVIGHSCMAPGRKIDPGARFDWARLARLGLAVWPPHGLRQAVDQGAFQRDLSTFGFPKAEADHRLQAFRLRFRYGHCGPLDEVDCGIAAWAATEHAA